ncbi:Nej1p [Saccharomyces paradoxus]|uniref:Nej1p n=3 Tax=Saccharomyces paradoxus TaxID=27291 RepID=A0A8B8UW70_SACPA|nr:Nej1 [Saccharomyces paradoxus]QHS74982.1 Nej1 [Saccharomyces paradoxus]
MDSEFIGRQLNDSEWFVERINGEGNCLLSFLPMSSSNTVLMIVLISLKHLVPNVFKLTQTQLTQQCQSQGFTDSMSLNRIKLRLMDILQSPQEINQVQLVDSNLNFSFDVSAEITVSINSVPSDVTKDTRFTILQSLCMLLLKLINISSQYQYIQRDILNEKQKCLDFLLRSLGDLDGGSKIIGQWAPENSKNCESLQPSTDDHVMKTLRYKGKFQHLELTADSLKSLLSLKQNLQAVSQIEEFAESNKKERAGILGANDLHNDDFELQLDPTDEAQPNICCEINPKTDSKTTAIESGADSQRYLEDVFELESKSPERTKSNSSLVQEYPRKKRKFGKVRIKN